MMESLNILMVCDSLNLIPTCKEAFKSMNNQEVNFIVSDLSLSLTQLTATQDVIDCVIFEYLDNELRRENCLTTLKNGHWPIVALCPNALIPKDHEICDYLHINELQPEILKRVVLHTIEKTKLTRIIEKRELSLQHLTYHDPICDLPNRLLFEITLAKSLARAMRFNRRTALLFLDIDVFKTFNDTLGHTAGDEILKQVTERLKSVMRKNDFLARLGSDEFGIILDEIDLFYGAGVFTERLEQALKVPFVIEEQQVFVTTSIGIATYPEAGNTPDNLMKNADMALSRVKEMGGNGYQYYSAEMNDKLVDFLETKNALYTALINKDFVLHYQPIFNIKTGAIIGLEALIRWMRGGTTLVPPDKFIPIAEKLGLIVPIGYWVIETVCQHLNTWQSMGISIPVAINASARQFGDKDFSKEIYTFLHKYKIDPKFISIELTESALMTNPVLTKKILNELKTMGVLLSIDDFGTGYSSLSYIKHLPVDTLKIDRMFIKDLPADMHDEAIVKSIITLTKALKIRTIAEGIETAEQQHLLQKLHCDYGQGFYFCKPADVKTITAFLLANKIEHQT